jgi:hypothetical protein
VCGGMLPIGESGVIGMGAGVGCCIWMCLLVDVPQSVLNTRGSRRRASDEEASKRLA